MKIIAVFLLTTLLVCAEASAVVSNALGLKEYLEQVRTKNLGVVGADAQKSGAELRSKEGQLLLSYTAFANLNADWDSKLPTLPLFAYEYQLTQSYSFGINKLYDFGLQAQLSYNFFGLSYTNPLSLFGSVPGFGNINFSANYYNVYPQLTLTQSLWSNGFGRSTRANQEMLESQALSTSYQAEFQSEASLVQAETAYWRLALARQLLTVSKAAHERAERMYEWSARRAKLHLADESDALQARAALELRGLDLQGTEDEVRTASRAFNTAREVNSDGVPEELAPIEPRTIENLKVPERHGSRADVLAAEEGMKAAQANATMAIERDKPTLNLTTSIASNRQPGVLTGIGSWPQDFGASVPYSFDFERPTAIVGVVFSMPLDFDTLAKSREGWNREQRAAELNYNQKQFEQDRDWNNLFHLLADARKRFELSMQVEKIQDEKLEREKTRLHQGRTTTYQVLLFETDYLSSQQARIRNEAEVLDIVAQMRLYGQHEGENP